jgi:tetratricopeptide (TPR) repeat protein
MKSDYSYLGNYFRTLLLLISGSFQTVVAQNFDSLWDIWNDPKQHDTCRLDAMYTISWEGFLFSEPDSALTLARMQFDFAKKVGDKYYMAIALNTIGVYHYFMDELQLAEENYLHALQLREEINDKKGIAGITGNLGLIYSSQGNNKKAIEFYLKSMKMQQEVGNSLGVANALNNIGNLYASINELDEAIVYYRKCFPIYDALNDEPGRGSTYNNIGGMYLDKNMPDTAIVYFEKALAIRLQTKEVKGIGQTLNNLGFAYFRKKDYEMAEQYFIQSLEQRQSIGDNSGMASTYKNLANLYNELHKYSQAAGFGLLAKKYAEETGHVIEIRDAYESLYASYSKLGKHQLALQALEQYILFKDSIFNEENKWEIIQRSFAYDQEIKDAADSVKLAEEEKLRQVENSRKDAELRTSRNYQIISLVALLFISSVTVYIYNRLRLIRKQKQLIEQQKKEVEQQKAIVDEKNQEISDSILYAKHIQSAIFPTIDEMNSHLRDGFILFRPKDVVSGDFYWMQTLLRKNEQGREQRIILVAAADCTGHGVPGALVSVVCSNALNRAVHEYGLHLPGEVLDQTKKIVEASFHQNNLTIDKQKKITEVKDGMDISLLTFVLEPSIDHQTARLSGALKAAYWAGANNPIWLIRELTENDHTDAYQLHSEDGKYGLIEIKGDAQPIGKYYFEDQFTTHALELAANDRLYLFSDGFADQFGGPKMKKYMYKSLKRFLLSIQDMPADDQKIILENEFVNWKGGFEQTDDVCMIHIRL